MPYYRRARVPGGIYFFTLVTERRAGILCEEGARGMLHEAIAECAARRPFVIRAMVLLPDHLHMLIKLPEGDGDFSTRLAGIKAGFTRKYLAGGGVEQGRSAARVRQRRRGVWQRWFWEHVIRDREDYERHLNYIHYNPVKHGHVACPHGWPFSTFEGHVERGFYSRDWLCCCGGRECERIEFAGLVGEEVEMGEGDGE